MRSLLSVIAIVVFIWLIKLSYDSIVFKNQLIEYQSQLRKSEQLNASLNDQLVAFQRKTPSTSPILPNQTNIKADSVDKQIQPVTLVKQKLELIKFAIQQNEYVYGIDQLNQLEQSIDQYALAETLKASLHKSIAQDKSMIQQYVSAQTLQEAQVAEVIQAVELNLKKESQYRELSPAIDDHDSFLNRWFKVDRVDQNVPNLINRKLVLKEIQVRAILAQNALIQGEYLQYEKMLDLMIAELSELPDQQSRNIQNQLIKLKQNKMSPLPKLSSLAILES